MLNVLPSRYHAYFLYHFVSLPLYLSISISFTHFAILTTSGTIVAWRGTLTKLMCAVYEQWNGWRIHARRRNGVVYLWEEETDEALTRRKQNEAQPESRDARMCYWGYKFEQFCCSANAEAVHAQDIETLSREWTQPVDTRASYCSLVATRLDRHPLLMAGEVDCCVPETPGVQSPTSVHSRYVELKTSRVLQSEHDQVKFERKMLKLWAQSFLLGIPTIIVGFRDDQGTVRDIQTFETVSMARLVRGKPHAWDASVALRSLSAILAHITLHLDRLEHSSSATLVEPALQLDFAKPFKAIHLSTSTVDFLS